ncbi:hypothetical protein DPMN_002000 [Dreissena polymorpha]|uniref:Uncharacterized protein n=1 Tax=Dreissena polymorpha TaxID=45954 RepID=A0A9D4RQU2_DREPO|nr:hypothetical protein DPMN_002000 [Dreissena polymorpha]
MCNTSWSVLPWEHQLVNVAMCNISLSVMQCDTSVGQCCHVQHQFVSAAICNISWLALACVTSVGQCCHV